MSEERVLTPLEERLIEAMREHLTIKDSAHAIGIKERTAYTILYRLRRKYWRARRLVNKLTSLMRGNELLRKALAKRYYPKESEVWLGDVGWEGKEEL